MDDILQVGVPPTSASRRCRSEATSVPGWVATPGQRYREDETDVHS